MNIRVAGQIDLAGLQRLRAALSHTEAKVRSVQADLSALRLLPTPEDIAALKADGYLGDVITELRERQEGPDGDASTEVAAHALGLLTSILTERQAPGTAALGCIGSRSNNCGSFVNPLSLQGLSRA